MILAQIEPSGTPDAVLPLSTEARAMNVRLRAIAERTCAAFFDPAEALCPDGKCPARAGDKDRYLDYGHFTPKGSRLAADACFADQPADQESVSIKYTRNGNSRGMRLICPALVDLGWILMV